MDGTSHPVAAVRKPLHSPIICFSPVRWRDARRLRILMSLFAGQRDVFFLEEPVRSGAESLQIRPCALTGVQVVTPLLPASGIGDNRRAALDLLLARSSSAIAWYAAPEARAFSDHVSWLATIYDCAGEPSAEGRPFEARLIQVADLVFAGGPGLYEERRHLHGNIHCFPGGIDLDRQQHMAALLDMAERNAALPPSLSRSGSPTAFRVARERVSDGG